MPRPELRSMKENFQGSLVKNQQLDEISLLVQKAKSKKQSRTKQLWTAQPPRGEDGRLPGYSANVIASEKVDMLQSSDRRNLRVSSLASENETCPKMLDHLSSKSSHARENVYVAKNINHTV